MKRARTSRRLLCRQHYLFLLNNFTAIFLFTAAPTSFLCASISSMIVQLYNRAQRLSPKRIEVGGLFSNSILFSHRERRFIPRSPDRREVLRLLKREHNSRLALADKYTTWSRVPPGVRSHESHAVLGMRLVWTGEYRGAVRLSVLALASVVHACRPHGCLELA